MTVQDSLAVNCFIDHAPPKIMARQWLQLYQRGPYWVVPSVISATIANLYLAWSDPSRRNIYAAGAALMWSILFITFLYFEPGINGACKWKVEILLASEGFKMPVFNGVPSSAQHSATLKTKLWAEKMSMKELVGIWAWRNHGRWIISLGAAVLSGYATLYL